MTPPDLDLVECGEGLVSMATPVTNAMWAPFAQVSGLGPWVSQRCPDIIARHPVVGVSRPLAMEFAVWAGDAIGVRLKLPAVSEWEYVAAGDEHRVYPWGDSWEEGRANTVEAGIGTTSPVDAHPGGASHHGILDMAGNVWEWCTDTDVEGWGLVKGGSWFDSEWGVRIARTLATDPGVGTANVGFRLVFDRRSTASIAPRE